MSHGSWVNGEIVTRWWPGGVTVVSTHPCRCCCQWVRSLSRSLPLAGSGTSPLCWCSVHRRGSYWHLANTRLCLWEQTDIKNYLRSSEVHLTSPCRISSYLISSHQRSFHSISSHLVSSPLISPHFTCLYASLSFLSSVIFGYFSPFKIFNWQVVHFSLQLDCLLFYFR